MIKDLCFEIIQKCPNVCKFCSSNASINASHIIEYSLFERVITHLIEHGGIEEISISGGEPFLHNDLVKMVKLCKSYNIRINVYTSGIIENPLRTQELSDDLSCGERRILEQIKQQKFSFIDKETLFRLKEAGLDKIVFDFQSADNDDYNFLMGTNNNFAHVLQSMLNAKFVGLYTEVHFIPMKTNYKGIEDILELCDIGEIDRISLLKFVPQGRGKINRGNLALNESELKEFCLKVERLKGKYNVDIRLGIPLSKGNEHSCTAGRDKLSIRYDGVVLPCVAFKELDTKDLNTLFKQNGLEFKTFSIQDNLELLVTNVGFNQFPLCKQVYH